jgi:hypothetical protein
MAHTRTSDIGDIQVFLFLLYSTEQNTLNDKLNVISVLFHRLIDPLEI